ncbi:MAG: PIN domain-containing protein [Bacillota bacterium]|nr:PIN domain-containing protein [Bacillota bacterium]
MQILVDTNVLLDYITCREPFHVSARTIIKLCKEGKVRGYIAAHSLTNIFYILRKAYSVEERRTLILDLCELFDVEGIDKNKIESTLTNETFDDLEDGLQYTCAVYCGVDYIVTRDVDGFAACDASVITPEDFLELV